MLSEPVKEAFGSFKRLTLKYAYFSALSSIFCALSILAALGFVILLFFLFSIFNYPILSLPGFITLVIIGLAMLWFISGIQGATIKQYGNLLSGKNSNLGSGFVEFLTYASDNASEFFLVSLVRLIITAIPVVLLYFIYTFLLQYNVPYIDWIFAIFVLGTVFFVYFLFFPVFISMAIYETGIGAAFKNAAKVFYRAHVKALVLYFVHAFVWVLNLIPIIQLVTVLFVYPITSAMLIGLFKRAAR